MKFSENQKKVISGVVGDVIAGKSQTSIGGLAGTGKTTCVNYILQKLEDKIKYVVLTPTGKAANVLRNKGVPANTIHSAIYNYKGKREDDEGKEHMIWKKKHAVIKKPRVMFIDEASMVNTKMFYDILQFGIQVVWIGDYGQLAPIGGDPGIMKSPRWLLTDIFRQGSDSGIVNFAHDVRADTIGMNYNNVEFSTVAPEYLVQEGNYDQIICGFNWTRRNLNSKIRANKKYKHLIEEGERLICVHNNKKANIFNGQQVLVKKLLSETDWRWKAIVETEMEGEREIWLNKQGFGAEKYDSENLHEEEILVDYGYVITCHKSQGSEWNNVLVINEQTKNWDHKRWLYTAATRAKNNLTLAL